MFNTKLKTSIVNTQKFIFLVVVVIYINYTYIIYINLYLLTIIGVHLFMYISVVRKFQSV